MWANNFLLISTLDFFSLRRNSVKLQNWRLKVLFVFYLTVLRVSLLHALKEMIKKEMQSYALESLHFSFKQDTVTENDK